MYINRAPVPYAPLQSDEPGSESDSGGESSCSEYEQGESGSSSSDEEGVVSQSDSSQDESDSSQDNAQRKRNAPSPSPRDTKRAKVVVEAAPSHWASAEAEGEQMLTDYPGLLKGAVQVAIDGHPIGAFLSRGFVSKVIGMDHTKIWAQCMAKKVYKPDAVLKKHDGSRCKWLPGAHVALNSRGNAVPRAKLWFQEGYAAYTQYSYTGWQNEVAYAACTFDCAPLAKDMCEEMNREALGLNHAIATAYAGGDDNIGFHHDKTKQFVPGSLIVCARFGGERLWQLRKGVAVGAKINSKGANADKPCWSETVRGGDAIIMHSGATNQLCVQHGVPAMEKADPSGSIVYRAIKTQKSWDAIAKAVAKTRAGRSVKAAARLHSAAPPPLAT